MLDVHTEGFSAYGCVFTNKSEAESYARALLRDDPSKRWQVSHRLIRAGGFRFPVYIVHHTGAHHGT